MVSNDTNILTSVLLTVVMKKKKGREVTRSLYFRSLPSPVFEVSVVRAGTSLELNLLVTFFFS